MFFYKHELNMSIQTYALTSACINILMHKQGHAHSNILYNYNYTVYILLNLIIINIITNYYKLLQVYT